MGRYLGPKTKRARRVREALRDKDVKILTKRNYPPGQHGQGRRRLSEYGVHLIEKQKAKWTYDISEKQLRTYFERASRMEGVTPQNLIGFLESRLDNVVYRLGFAESRAQARQLVGHRFISVNGKRVNIPSYLTKVGDEISIHDGKQSSKYVQTMTARLKEFKPQDWLSVEAADMRGKILTKPSIENTASTIQLQLIAEYYNR